MLLYKDRKKLHKIIRLIVMTFGKDKTTGVTKKPLSLVMFVGLCIIVVAGFILQDRGHEDIISRLKKEIVILEKHSDTIPKHNFEHVDKDVLDWAYKKAQKHVPISHVATVLYYAQDYNNYLMMIALIAEESAFDTYAKSTKSARGLPQIMWDVWGDTLKAEGILTEKIDLYDARYSIPACDYILNDYKKQFGDWHTVLNRYVNGDKDYVMRVLSNYAELTLIVNDRNTKGATAHEPNPNNHKG